MDFIAITWNLIFICVIFLLVACAWLIQKVAELTANLEKFIAKLVSLSKSMEEKENKNAFLSLKYQLLKNEEATRKLECEMCDTNRDVETLKSYGANLSQQVDKIQATTMMKLQRTKFQISSKLQGNLAVGISQIKSIKNEMKMANKLWEEKERAVNERLEMHTAKLAAVEEKLDEISAPKSVEAKDSSQTEALRKPRKIERGREEFGYCNYPVGYHRIYCNYKRRAAICFLTAQIKLRCTRTFDEYGKPNCCPGQHMLSDFILSRTTPASRENLKKVVKLAFHDIQENVRKRLTDEGFAKFLDLNIEDYIKNQDLLKTIIHEYIKGKN